MTKNLWPTIKSEAEKAKKSDPEIQSLVAPVLQSETLGLALAQIIGARLFQDAAERQKFTSLFLSFWTADAEAVLNDDLRSILDHDPAVKNILTPVLFFKGFHALQTYRLAHYLWTGGRQLIAEWLQARSSVVFGVDIHPAAKIGRGIMMDHATGIVIGETATVGDNVLFWHNVTLGGKSSANTDRHPKIGNHVILGAGALLLGNIKIGDGAKIGAGAIVVKDVAPGATVISAKSV